MESHLNAGQSSLSSVFKHTLPPTADYVQDRKMVRFYPQGSNVYSPSGVKMLRFSVVSDSWLDPMTCNLNFQVVNDSYDGTGNTNIHMVNGSWAWFKRLRVTMGGALVEDLAHYPRLWHMLLQAAPAAYRDNLSIPAGKRGDIVTNSEKFAWPILCGILQQDKCLPLRYCNLQLEFELVDNIADVMVESGALPSGVTGQSTNWHVQDVFITADLLTLDSGLDAEFANHLMKGKSLNLCYTSYYTSNHVVAQGFQIALTRALTRIRALYLTTMRAAAGDKEAYDLRYPSIDAANVFEFQLQLGAKLYPEQKITTVPEYWWKYVESIGTHASVLSTSAISQTGYTSDSFIVGINMQKLMAEEGMTNYSGTSSKAGQLLSIRTDKSATAIDRCFVTLTFDGIVSISEAGVEVFD